MFEQRFDPDLDVIADEFIMALIYTLEHLNLLVFVFTAYH